MKSVKIGGKKIYLELTKQDNDSVELKLKKVDEELRAIFDKEELIVALRFLTDN